MSPSHGSAYLQARGKQAAARNSHASLKPLRVNETGRCTQTLHPQVSSVPIRCWALAPVREPRRIEEAEDVDVRAVHDGEVAVRGVAVFVDLPPQPVRQTRGTLGDAPVVLVSKASGYFQAQTASLRVACRVLGALSPRNPRAPPHRSRRAEGWRAARRRGARPRRAWRARGRRSPGRGSRSRGRTCLQAKKQREGQRNLSS